MTTKAIPGSAVAQKFSASLNWLWLLGMAFAGFARKKSRRKKIAGYVLLGSVLFTCDFSARVWRGLDWRRLRPARYATRKLSGHSDSNNGIPHSQCSGNADRETLNASSLLSSSLRLRLTRAEPPLQCILRKRVPVQLWPGLRR